MTNRSFSVVQPTMMMPPFYRAGSAILLAVALAVSSAHGQAVPELELGSAAELPEIEFSRINGMRELSDGRVLVADAIENQLFVVDFARRTSTRLGRSGGGPGEYRGITRVLALPRDTTLIVDIGGRWLLMAGSSFIGVVTPADPAMTGGRLPTAADARGRLLKTASFRNLEGVSGMISTRTDSSWVLLTTRKSGAVDSLAKTKVRPSAISMTSSRGVTQSVSIRVNPLSAGEQATLFADGTVAIARLNPYRVDWIGAARVDGPPLPYEAIAVDRDEKVAALARLPRADDRAAPDPESIADWPEVIPPFLTGALLAAPDGRLWIRRAPSRRAPGTDYDVVGRDGKLVSRLHIATNEHVLGFGSSWMYIVATDDDGLQRLKRYSFPR